MPDISRRFALKLLATPLVLPSHVVFAQTSRPRALIVGCGNRGKMLAEILAAVDDAPLIVGLVDTELAKASALADKLVLDAPVFTSIEAALKAGAAPDLATVATYNNQHLPNIAELIDAGAHVYTEKPMTADLDQARSLLELDEENPSRIQVGLQFRHAPLYAEVKRLIDAGTIGNVQYISAQELRGDWFRFFPNDPTREKATNWRYFEETCGNSILEKLCHDMDILCHVSGLKPVRVIASGGKAVHRDRETDDHASIILEFPGAAKLDISFSLFSNAHKTETVIMGDNGSLTFERTGDEIRIFEGKPWSRKKPDQVVNVNPEKKSDFGYHGTAEGLQAFSEVVKSGGNFYPAPQDAWLSMAVCCAADHSTDVESAAIDLVQGEYQIAL